jgi:hypothetical protein
MMRAYWSAERAKGRMPSGAELDRHVGRDPSNGAGRKARARYLREEAQGRFTAPAVPAPEASVPAAGALGARERPGTALAGAPDWPTAPVPAGNGHRAPQDVPATLESFPRGHRDREGSDA